jgi:hypothetical protein
VIDACFGGTFDNQVASLRGPNDLDYPEASKAEIVARKSRLTTRLFLTSGGKEYVQDGRPGAHSPFASEIPRALRTYGGDSGLVTFQDLFQQVDKTIQNNPQYGWFGKAEPGSDFWFAPTPTLTTEHRGDSTPARVASVAPRPEIPVKTSVPVVYGVSSVSIPSVSYDSAADPLTKNLFDSKQRIYAQDLADIEALRFRYLAAMETYFKTGDLKPYIALTQFKYGTPAEVEFAEKRVRQGSPFNPSVQSAVTIKDWTVIDRSDTKATVHTKISCSRILYGTSTVEFAE